MPEDLWRSPLLPDRFWSKVKRVRSTGCWKWTAAASEGYGRFWWAEKVARAHKVAWEALVGPVPEGRELDHIVCGNTLCVNPAHLRVVTHAENMAREMPRAWEGNRRKTHCPAGHPYDAENTYKGPKGRGCKACRLAASRRFKRRRKEQAA